MTESGAETVGQTVLVAEEARGLRFGSFDLDLESSELLRSGIRVRLQLQPFRVLVLLASQPGRLVSREELRREFWSNGSFVDSEQTLNSCIRQIRSALGDNANSPRYVETLPRRGYRFIAPVQVITLPASPRPLPAATESPQAWNGAEPQPAEAGGALPRSGPATRPSTQWLRLVLAALAGAALALAVARGFRVVTAGGTGPAPVFRRLTYQRGYITSARFGPGGQVLYGAAWEGGGPGAYMVRPENPDTRLLEAIGPELVAAPASGEVAFLTSSGTLSRAPVNGGSPKPVLEGIRAADWNRAGSTFAVARGSDYSSQIEYPVGTVLCAAVRPTHLRISPTGDHVAFLEHPVRGDDRGAVVVVDRQGRRTTLSEGWGTLEGLAWDPDGDEVWFTASRVGPDSSLHAVTLTGEHRNVFPAMGRLIIHDISPQGRVLLERRNTCQEIRYRRSGERAERDLSWLDRSKAVQLSADGEWLLFSEAGVGGGGDYGVYLRKTDGSLPIRVGSGRAMALSPDGQWVLAIPVDQADHIEVLPVGAGEIRRIRDEAISAYEWAGWLPDGKRIVFTGRSEGSESRTFVRDLSGGLPQPITPPGVATWANTVSPDGRHVAAPCGPRMCLYPVDGGEAQPVPGLGGSDAVLGWGLPRKLLVRSPPLLPARIQHFDLETGLATLWLDLAPTDRSGVVGMNAFAATPDGAAYAYSYSRALSDLYVAERLE